MRQQKLSETQQTLHEEEEIQHLLDEARREVQDEIQFHRELSEQAKEWGTHDEHDNSLPDPTFEDGPLTIDIRGPAQAPIGVEAAILNNIIDDARIRGEDMGWNGPSASTVPHA
jgi:hypothetical protein